MKILMKKIECKKVECTREKGINCLISGNDYCPGCEFEERIIITNKNKEKILVCRSCMSRDEFEKLSKMCN